MLRKLAKAVRDHRDVLGVAISVAPLVTLFLPWFEHDGPIGFLIFSEADTSLTAWEMFSWQDITVAVVASGLAAAAIFHRGSTPRRLWPVGLAVFGVALAVTMNRDPLSGPVEVDPAGQHDYEPTHLGWIAVAGFAVPAVTYGVRWWRAPGHIDQP